MARPALTGAIEAAPSWPAVLELLKPHTWFPPMWAFACGVVCVGVPTADRWPVVFAGILVAGPLICGTSQAVNDWFDRHVDAINEPERPIPSGRIPGRWGLYVALGWTAVSLLVATALGFWGFVAAAAGMVLAWAYSAPPIRLKRNGWWGNTAVAVCYEGLPWFTGAAVMAAALPDSRVLILALLYSAGAHGIMTLNDFKSVEGDRRTGIGSLPVRLGITQAARLACMVMIGPQLIVIALLASWGHFAHSIAVAGLLVVQLGMMARLLGNPRELDYWYNATGVPLYVIGMMVSAFALRAGVAA